MMPKRSMSTFLFFYPAVLVVLVRLSECVSTLTDRVAPPEVTEHNSTLYAACKMRPSTRLPEDLPKIYGDVLFRQEYPQGTLQVLFRLNGFPKGIQEPHAVHIHQYGDLSQGCDSTGGHYNPLKVAHPNHPGDFGNFVAHKGRIIKLMETAADLFGELSVIGRSVVVHEKVDDLGAGGNAGSLLNGNAGQKLGCCVIGISSPKLWNVFHNGQQRRL